jgi:hypothetical protein
MTNNEKTVFRRLITNPKPQQYVILNTFQDLSAEKDNKGSR